MKSKSENCVISLELSPDNPMCQPFFDYLESLSEQERDDLNDIVMHCYIFKHEKSIDEGALITDSTIVKKFWMVPKLTFSK